MTVSITFYNHTVKKFVAKEIDFTTLKLELLSNSATFDATHTTKTQVDNAGAYEVYGNGWAQGGPTVANVTVTTVTTNDAKLDADDVSVTASGASIGPAYKALLYDATGNVPLAFVDFGGANEAGDTTDFVVRWPTAGIITFNYTP